MRIQSLFLVSLLAGLCGCQPEVPVQEIVPATVPASAVSAAPAAAKVSAVVEAAVPAVVETVAASAEPAVRAVAPVKAAVPEKVVAVKAAPVAVKAAPVVEKAAQAAVKAAEPVKVAEEAPKVVAAVRPPVTEAEAMAVAKKSDCMACHAIDHKVVGPGWRDVAEKYRGDASAEAKLVAKIAQGGGGIWGSMKMPAHSKLSEAEIRTLVRFVLELK